MPVNKRSKFRGTRTCGGGYPQKPAVVQVIVEVVEQPDGVTTTLPAGIFSGKPRENTDLSVRYL